MAIKDFREDRAFILGWRRCYGEEGVMSLDRQLVNAPEWAPEVGSAELEKGIDLGIHAAGRLTVADSNEDECSETVRAVLVKYGSRAMAKDQIDGTQRFVTMPGLLSWVALWDGPALVGAYSGFFWRPDLWVRRFYGVVNDTYPWPEHLAAEQLIHRRLWDRGMRDALLSIPEGTPNLEARVAQGWVPSHLVYVTPVLPRPFVLLRKAFPERP